MDFKAGKRTCLLVLALLLLEVPSCLNDASIKETDASGWIALPADPHPMNLSVVPGLPIEFSLLDGKYSAEATAQSELLALGEAGAINSW